MRLDEYGGTVGALSLATRPQGDAQVKTRFGPLADLGRGCNGARNAARNAQQARCHQQHFVHITHITALRLARVCARGRAHASTRVCTRTQAAVHMKKLHRNAVMV